MMRKMICFLLVLAISLSLACPALAATNSPGSGGKPIYTPGSNPKTGDDIMIYAVIMLLALLALIVLLVISRKVFRKN